MSHDTTPLSFTRREFWSGAIAAWCAFMIILTVTLMISAIATAGMPWGSLGSTLLLYLLYGIPFGGIVAAIVTLLSLPIVWPLSRLLRRSESVTVHIVAYLLLGGLLGFAVCALNALSNGSGDVVTVFQSPVTWLVMLACAVSVAAGWAWAARTTLRLLHRRRAEATAPVSG
ncbi:hypothetical protein [uncultured Microbacterium sp.]|uniref:hypothetical protein n=1 Tax=uncultured Microbacterium sp. TaxID=191216 RepID=UPI00261AB437|nr:hypothetical protein [uncultured Microbacterium sp.]